MNSYAIAMAVFTKLYRHTPAVLPLGPYLYYGPCKPATHLSFRYQVPERKVPVLQYSHYHRGQRVLDYYKWMPPAGRCPAGGVLAVKARHLIIQKPVYPSCSTPLLSISPGRIQYVYALAEDTAASWFHRWRLYPPACG